MAENWDEIKEFAAQVQAAGPMEYVFSVQAAVHNGLVHEEESSTAEELEIRDRVHNPAAHFQKVGFWKMPANAICDCDAHKFPSPIENEITAEDSTQLSSDLEAYEKLLGKEAYVDYMGVSSCRLCNLDDGNGSREYYDNGFCWPGGLLHYIKKHRVGLPSEFVEMIRAKKPQPIRAEYITPKTAQAALDKIARHKQYELEKQERAELERKIEAGEIERPVRKGIVFRMEGQAEVGKWTDEEAYTMFANEFYAAYGREEGQADDDERISKWRRPKSTIVVRRQEGETKMHAVFRVVAGVARSKIAKKQLDGE